MSRKDIPKPFRKAARLAESRGWRIKHGGSHLKWKPPYPGRMVITPSTPGEGRSIENAMAKLKRAGLPVGRGRD